MAGESADRHVAVLAALAHDNLIHSVR